MFITSYDIELRKANKNFDFSTTRNFLKGSDAVQVVLLIQKEVEIQMHSDVTWHQDIIFPFFKL